MLIEAKNVTKIFKTGEVEVKACNNMNFSIETGELVIIVGPSGAGKTTLLNLLGGMDQLTEGELISCGVLLKNLSNRKLTEYRRNKVGFVFQFYNLMPNLTAEENVELAIELKKNHLPVDEMIDRVGLKDKRKNFPSQLSGGEQQRVSIARATSKNPDLLLCDEPTGALDYTTGKKVLELLEILCREEKKTVIIVTHNGALKDMADKVIYVKSGEIERIDINPTPKSIKEIEW